MKKLSDNSKKLIELPCRISRGSSTGNDKLFVLEEKEGKLINGYEEIVDLEDEIFLPLEPGERRTGHLGERGHRCLEFRIGQLVDRVRQVRIGEEPEQPRVGRRGLESGGVFHHAIAGGGKLGAHVALILALGGIEEGFSTAEQDFDLLLEVLLGDELRVVA